MVQNRWAWYTRQQFNVDVAGVAAHEAVLLARCRVLFSLIETQQQTVTLVPVTTRTKQALIEISLHPLVCAPRFASFVGGGRELVRRAGRIETEGELPLALALEVVVLAQLVLPFQCILAQRDVRDCQLFSCTPLPSYNNMCAGKWLPLHSSTLVPFLIGRSARRTIKSPSKWRPTEGKQLWLSIAAQL